MSWLLLLAGCATCPPLGEVPIRNADGQTGLIRDELAAFGEETVLDVCIDHVRVGAYRYGGRYNRATHGVRIARDTDEHVVWALRHEVCHGVDVQNDLLDGDENRETFAERCANGGPSLAVLTETGCATEPSVRETLQVRDAVFGPPVQPGAAFTPVASAELPSGVIERIGEGANGASVVVLYESPEQSVAFDPFTGEEVDDTAFLADEDVVWHEGPPWWDVYSAGSAGDLDLVYAVLSLPEGFVHRVLRADGAGWAPTVGSCLGFRPYFFALQGGLWSADVEGDTLTWGRWDAI